MSDAYAFGGSNPAGDSILPAYPNWQRNFIQSEASAGSNPAAGTIFQAVMRIRVMGYV